MSAGGRDRLAEGDRELARLTPRARRAVAPVAGFLLLTWAGFYFAAQFELELQRWIIALGTAVLVLLLCVPGIAGWASIRYRITQRGLHARRGVLSVRRADLDYRTAQEQSSAAAAQLRASELALESSQARYQAGAATLVELSQARASQVQAASSVVSARYNLLFQRSLMDYYLGELRVP